VADRRSRALEEPLDVRRRPAPYPQFEVRNPLHGTSYRVMLPEFPRRASELCTCTDFARRGLGTCKHIEAAYRWASDHATEPASPPSSARPGPSPESVWKEIDRRLAAPGAGPAPQRLRRPGAALFERGARAGRPANE
jgi:hypothetical protein